MVFDEGAGPASTEPPAGRRAGSGPWQRWGFLTATIVVLTALAGVTAAAAVREPADDEQPLPAASTAEWELWHHQEVLSDLGAWIAALPGIKTSGYVTNINNPEAGSTILVWYGPPDRVQRQIMDEAQRRHIPISIEHRKHSLAALERAVDQLVAIDSGTGVFQNFTVSAVGTLSIDFDGVTVKGDYIHPPAEGVPAADTALARALAALTGVAVEIEHGQIVPV